MLVGNSRRDVFCGRKTCGVIVRAPILAHGVDAGADVS